MYHPDSRADAAYAKWVADAHEPPTPEEDEEWRHFFRIGYSWGFVEGRDLARQTHDNLLLEWADAGRQVGESRAMLRRVEWSGGNSQARRCPVCGGREKPAKTYPTGHQPGCELQKMVGRG